MKLLFISNELSKTGSPLVLLTFIKWLRERESLDIRIISLFDGELSVDFQSFGKILIIEQSKKSFFTNVRWGLKRFLPGLLDFINTFRAYIFLFSFQPELIYANSVASIPALLWVKRFKTSPVLCHVHELEYSIDFYQNRDGYKIQNSLIDVFITLSAQQSILLQTKYQIAKEKIRIIPPHIYLTPAIQTSHEVRKKMKVGENDFVIIGCGTLCWQKSPELFIMTAKSVMEKTNKKFKFVWIGKHESLSANNQLESDIKRLSLIDIVFLIGFQENPIDFFAHSDVFYLSSREDSFPLVCLEAASQGKPIICFNGSGGITEFVSDDCGFVVPFIDIEKAADKIIQLMEDSTLKNLFGENGKRKVFQGYTVDQTGPKILDVINNLRQ